MHQNSNTQTRTKRVYTGAAAGCSVISDKNTESVNPTELIFPFEPCAIYDHHYFGKNSAYRSQRSIASSMNGVFKGTLEMPLITSIHEEGIM